MHTLYTIGHSIRPYEEFLAILKAHKISHLVDIRAIPRSRRYPWFNKEALEFNLGKEKIFYSSLPELGGMRVPVENSINTGWRKSTYKGFADYMQTPEFFAALKQLNGAVKQPGRVAIMCAEALPENCHRSLISDAEKARDVKVLHIINVTDVKEHEFTRYAKVDKECKPVKVFYPK